MASSSGGIWVGKQMRSLGLRSSPNIQTHLPHPLNVSSLLVKIVRSILYHLAEGLALISGMQVGYKRWSLLKALKYLHPQIYKHQAVTDFKKPAVFACRAVLVQLGFYFHMKWTLGVAALSLTRPLTFAMTFMLFASVVIALFKDIPDVRGDQQVGRFFSLRRNQLWM